MGAMNEQVVKNSEFSIVVDMPNIFDVAVEGRAQDRKGGVRHEVRPDGEHVRVREVWYFCDTNEEAHAAEVRLPVTRLVHLVVNTTEEERRLLADVRTTSPGRDREAWHCVPPMELPYEDEIAAIVRAYVAGPKVPPPGSSAAGSATEDRAIERWRYDLMRRAEVALNRMDQNTEGRSVALSIRNTLRSDRIVDQPAAVLNRVLG